MSSDNRFKIKIIADSYILYDSEVFTDPDVQLFDVDYHTKTETRQNNSSASGIGRARVVYFQQGEYPLVLKHYFRGGLVARLFKDCYLGRNIENSRSFREWRLLRQMSASGLPVPVAVAARVQKAGLCYRADLITCEIKNSKTLAETLSLESLAPEYWQQIGRCIKQFHDRNIYHADLNARNILLDDSWKVFLIDFDSSYVRTDREVWKMANLSRLQRSLLKFCRHEDSFHYTESDWENLLLGYRS